jgi:hypothetical protein
MNQIGTAVELTQPHVPPPASFYIFEASTSSNLSSYSINLSYDLYQLLGFKAQLLEAKEGFCVGREFGCPVAV